MATLMQNYKIMVELDDGQKLYLGEHTKYAMDDVWLWMDRVVHKHAPDPGKVIASRGHRQDLAGYSEISDVKTFEDTFMPRNR